MATTSKGSDAVPDTLLRQISGSTEDLKAGRVEPIGPVIAGMRRRAQARRKHREQMNERGIDVVKPA